MQDWLTMTAADLGRGISAGDIDPVDLTRTFLSAIDAHPDRDRIYSCVTHDRALAEASAAKKRADLGQRRSPLDGVPVSWKDLVDSEGTATEAGSALLKNRVPDLDAQVLKTATGMGTVCLGKTHMSELAFSGLGYNPITGTPACINDPEAVPGGSSSGAAASVAFGLAPIGIGSDTGGSVRVPAAWNDLVGLKTTAGRVSLEGIVPLCLRFDTIGPLSRSVEDAALMLAALEGTPSADLRGATLRNKRLAILDTVAMEGLRDAPRQAFDSAVERLRSAGAIIDRVEVPELEDAMAMAGIAFTSEAYGLWGDVIEANPDVMFPEILKRFRIGAEHSAANYVSAWARIDAARMAYDIATAPYDAVICPTAPNLPPSLGRLLEDEDYFVTENLLTLRNTRVGNLMGLTALTLPTGVPSCGIMFLSAPDTEERLLRIGAAAETALA